MKLVFKKGTKLKKALPISERRFVFLTLNVTR